MVTAAYKRNLFNLSESPHLDVVGFHLCYSSSFLNLLITQLASRYSLMLLSEIMISAHISFNNVSLIQLLIIINVLAIRVLCSNVCLHISLYFSEGESLKG